MSGSDVEVLRRWAGARNAEAFAELVARYGGAVYGACLRILRNPTDAEDITQQCFLELAQHPPTIRSSLGGWLHRLATHRALNHVRGERRRREREHRFAEGQTETAQPEWDDISEYIDEAIAALKPALRDVIVLRYLRGQTQDDVAAALDIAPRTVRYRQHQGVESIRKHLRRRGVAVKTGLVALLASHLASTADASKLPSALQAELGRIALSGIVPETSWGANIAQKLQQAWPEGVPWKALGASLAIATIIGLGTTFYFLRQTPEPATPVAATAQTPKPVENAPSSEDGGVVAARAPEASVEPADENARITGVVRDPDGNPVVGAALDRNRTDSLATTNAEGRFALGEERLNGDRLWIRHGDFEPVETDRFLADYGGPVYVDVTMRKPVATVITVVGPDGKPAVGAEVMTSQLGAIERVGVTDGHGRVAVPGRSRTYAVFQLGLGGATLRPDSPSLVRLVKPVNVMLTVLHEGEPVSGARVSCDLGGQGWNEAIETDAHGRAKATFMHTSEPRQVTAEYRPEGGLPLFGRATVHLDDSGPNECLIHLDDPFVGRLHGRLLNADGTPREGNNVGVRWSSDPVCEMSTTTSSDGSFELPLFEGPNALFARIPKGMRWANPEAAEIVASRGEGTLFREFRFVESTDVLALEELTLALEFATPDRPESLMVSVDNWWLGSNLCWIEIPADDLLRLSLGHRGTPWRVFVVDKDHGRAGSWLRAASTDAPTIRLDVAVGSVHGVVRDEADEPVAYAYVETDMDMTVGGVSTQTNASGAFTLWPVRLGVPLELKVRAEGHVETRLHVGAAESSKSVRVVLQRNLSVLAGEVQYEDGTPVPGGVVNCSPEGDDGRAPVSAPIVAGQFRQPVTGGMWQVSANDRLLESDPVLVRAPDETIVLTIARRTGPLDPAARQAKAERGEFMKTFGLIFMMYSNESKGELFPPLSAVQGALHPDMKLLYPEYVSDASYVSRGSGQGDTDMCYLGHLVDSEAAGLAFLDAYTSLGVDAVRENDITVADGQGSFGGDTLVRLSPSQDWTEAGQMGAVPVMWEVPDPARDTGGWVVYMDGHAAWVEYPGQFPMTEAFVARVREIQATTGE